MERDRLSGKLAVILHADIAGSTALVQQDKQLAHERIQDSFRRLSNTIEKYQGRVLELRGDALLAEFARASDAVSAALSFQVDHAYYIDRLKDGLRPTMRVGIAMGEVIIADNTVTGAGVVQAQRVEQLADPGDVCITAAIQEALSERMPIDLENLGEQVLKGFDYSVQIYRVELRPGESILPAEKSSQRDAPTKSWGLLVAVVAIALVVAGSTAYWYQTRVPQEEPALVENMAYPLPDKPSIAVLPFTNMSNDAEQEYFADGMTEDLITDISKVSGLFVIARNSVFTYKGKAVKVRQVAEELGVRYVMEGSVRRVGNQVRINAQLIDATTGGHIWADRYDGSLDDVFSMQDKITQSIVTALSVTLTGQDQSSLVQAKTNKPEAYDAFLRGWQLYRRYTPEDFVKAIPHFKRAVEIDPDYGQAWAALASLYWISYQNSYAWTFIVNPNRDISSSWLQTRLKAGQYLEQAMKHPTPLAHQVESYMSWDYRQFDKALNEAEKAVTLDPNNPEGHLAMAWALIFAGRAGEAVASAENGMQLDPYYPAPHLYVLGMAHLMMGKYTEAETALERGLGLNPENKNPLLPLTVAYVHLNKHEKAGESLKQFIDFFILYAPRIETYIEWWPFKRETDIRFFGGGLIQAGLCCEEQLEAYIGRVRQGGTLE
jgi:adenylate cyclase